MRAYVFPGQGAQFPGMGKEIYKGFDKAKELFEMANEQLGFRISDIMFDGTEEALKETKVTQPAIFLHSTVLAKVMGEEFKPEMVAGHSLGEFSALVASNSMSFEDGLNLVSKRAIAMQKACREQASTMAAILGLEDEVVEDVCSSINGIVVPANYNCPGQLVISGEVSAIDEAIEVLKEKGAKRALKLMVDGAFHSPLMEPARDELAQAINDTKFEQPSCPIYQNYTARSTRDPQEIKKNLIAQLTAPVRWTQTMNEMIKDGALSFTEVGPGKVLQGLVKKVDRKMEVSSAFLS